tara:strand:+ start:847 stop:1224 length:378 start_codon:yes stop_codon:yes gene_type:complete
MKGYDPQMLRPKQQCFVEEYLIDLNATQAAIRAGYSERSANPQAARLLAKDSIKAAIAEAIAVRSAESEITVKLVLDGLLREAKFTGEGTSHAARVAAWEKLGKYLQLFVDRHEHAGYVTLEVVD